MVELHESSGLHSLAALREHENAQIQLRIEASRARAEAEQRARLEAERAALSAQRERERAERAAADGAERAHREELARLDAARAAELERAEQATRNHERLQLEIAKERAERRSLELRFSAQLSRQRLFTVLAGALCVFGWLGSAAAYFGALRPDSERRQQSTQRALGDEQRARRDVETRAAHLAQRNDELNQRLSDVEKALLQVSAPAPARPALRAPQSQSTLDRGRGVRTSQPPCRDDGDPLNPCLKGH